MTPQYNNMSKELRMLAYKNRVLGPAAPGPHPENTSPFAPLNPHMSQSERRRLQSQINTVVFSTFSAIGDPKTPPQLKKKYCDKLREMGIREDSLHPWCKSQGGGKKRSKKTLKKGRRRMTRRR